VSRYWFAYIVYRCRLVSNVIFFLGCHAIGDDVGDHAMPEQWTLSSEALTSCVGLTSSFQDAVKLSRYFSLWHWRRQLWGTGARAPHDVQLVILGITRFSDSDESRARFSVQ